MENEKSKKLISEELTSSKGKTTISIISVIFYVIAAITMIAGLIMGIDYLRKPSQLIYSTGTNYNTVLGISYIVGGFISGMLLIGFGRIIDLLNEISKKNI